MSDPSPSWDSALLAARLFALDPFGFGGVVVRARAGPVRDIWLGHLVAMAPQPVRRLPPDIADDRLLGGIDLPATLKTGRPVAATGLLTEMDGGVLIAPMAERMTSGLSARLGAALDSGRVIAARAGQSIDTASAFGLVLLDEGTEPDECAPPPLADRLAFRVDLTDIALRTAELPASADLSEARARLGEIRTPSHVSATLAVTATQLGIHSARAPLLALRAARGLAALDGVGTVSDAHVTTAAALVFAHRATQMPAVEDEEDNSPPPPDPDDRDQPADRENSGQDRPLEDRVVEAVAAILPDLGLAEQARRRGSSDTQGAGTKQTATHGRPAGTARGKGDGRARLDLLATLREAAPWQTLRKSEAPDRPGLIVHPDDFRVRRFVRPAESVLIFVVDASGSAAAARLAEAKGAVELMLAEAYRRREKVALISFRGTTTELLLPPTRSLLQAKKRLAILPGGGGTPLASALMAGHAMARQVRQRGATPYLVFLTDGRGNISLDGSPGRAAAREDAQLAARALAADRFVSVLIDTANRPQADAAQLAREMDARYLPLPRADARKLSRAVRAVTAPA